MPKQKCKTVMLYTVKRWETQGIQKLPFLEDMDYCWGPKKTTHWAVEYQVEALRGEGPRHVFGVEVFRTWSEAAHRYLDLSKRKLESYEKKIQRIEVGRKAVSQRLQKLEEETTEVKS